MVTIDGYPVDLVESEEHVLAAEVTDHPVEDGADVSDNVRLKPRELTLTNAVVSNNPIGTIATDPTRQLNGSMPPPAQDAWRRLQALWLARKAVTVVTDFQKYESMVLDQLTVPRDSKTYGGLVFTAHFKEVRIVQNKFVTMKLPNTGAEQNLGLSANNIVAGQNILWRKGNPPGSSPQTTPPGTIVGQEVVVMVQSGSHTKFTHQSSGLELTNAEYATFQKDLNRDLALMQNRNLQGAINQYAASDDKEGKAYEAAIAKYNAAHPGQAANTDPSVVGYTKDPSGHYTVGGWTPQDGPH